VSEDDYDDTCPTLFEFLGIPEIEFWTAKDIKYRDEFKKKHPHLPDEVINKVCSPVRLCSNIPKVKL
jgi:hypothetical protein